MQNAEVHDVHTEAKGTEMVRKMLLCRVNDEGKLCGMKMNVKTRTKSPSVLFFTNQWLVISKIF